MDRAALGCLAVLIGIALAGIHTTPTFYTSDAQSYYDQSRLLQQGRMTSDTRVRGWIPIDGGYSTPHSPGYSLFSLPVTSAVQATSLYGEPAYTPASGFRRDTYDLYRSRHLMERNGSIRIGDGAQIYMKSLWKPQEVSIDTGSDSRTITLDQNGTMVDLRDASGIVRIRATDCWELGRLAPKPVYDQCGSIGIGLEEDTHADLQLWPKTLTLGSGERTAINITLDDLYRLRFRARGINGTAQLHVDGKQYTVPPAGRIVLTGRRYQGTVPIGVEEGPVTMTYFSEKVDRLFHPHTDHQYRLDGPWYLQEGLSGLRWSGGNASMSFREPITGLDLDMVTYGNGTTWIGYQDHWRELEIGRRGVVSLDPDQPVRQVRFRTTDCGIPAQDSPETSKDLRCLAYGYRGFDPEYATGDQEAEYIEPGYRLVSGFQADSYDLYRARYLMSRSGELTVIGPTRLYMKSLYRRQQVTLTGDGRSRTITLDQNGTMVDLSGFQTSTISIEAADCWQLGRLAPRQVYSQCASIGIGLEDDSHADLELWPKTLTLDTGEQLPVNITLNELYRLSFQARGVNGTGRLRVDGGEYHVPDVGRQIITQRRYQDLTNITVLKGPVTMTYFSEEADRLFHPHTDHQYRLDGPWYLEERSGLRWASGNTTIVFREPVTTVILDARTYGDHRLWARYHNTTEPVQTHIATSTVIDPEDPIRRLELRTDGCTIPAADRPDVSSDRRCLAYGYSQLLPRYVTPPAEP